MRALMTTGYQHPDDERAGKRRKLEPEEEQRQLRERLHLEQRALQEKQMQEQVRQHFLHYARQNGIAQQDQVEILDQLMSYPYEEQRAYINKMKERAEAVAMRLRQEAHQDAQRAERVAQLERHEAALEHQKAAEEGVVVVLGGGDAANEDVLEAADVEADDEAEAPRLGAGFGALGGSETGLGSMHSGQRSLGNGVPSERSDWSMRSVQ